MFSFRHSLLALLATVCKSIFAFVPERCNEMSNVNADPVSSEENGPVNRRLDEDSTLYLCLIRLRNVAWLGLNLIVSEFNWLIEISGTG